MREKIVALLLALIVLLTGNALAANYRADAGNAENFAALLLDLIHACESPSEADRAAIEADVAAIAQVSSRDGAIARSVAEHWQRVYVNSDGSYQPVLYAGGSEAPELALSPIPDSPAHAFVVLGFELKNGEMTDELKQRCDAAAAAARSYPETILVCSGGATGKNNPGGHTEAGLMKAYLTGLGIEADRIIIDEQAMTTVDNAVNTVKMLMDRQVSTMTLVTSSYHQRWGQVIYNAVAAVCRELTGYALEIVGNYSCPVEPSERYRRDHRIAARQLCAVLSLPEETVEAVQRGL